jgi:hypothetical protein
LKHKITKDFASYQWSSYHEIIFSTERTKSQQELIDWFGNVDRFVNIHLELSQFYSDSETAIED